jgi:hypothetical protein
VFSIALASAPDRATFTSWFSLARTPPDASFVLAAYASPADLARTVQLALSIFSRKGHEGEIGPLIYLSCAPGCPGGCAGADTMAIDAFVLCPVHALCDYLAVTADRRVTLLQRVQPLTARCIALGLDPRAPTFFARTTRRTAAQLASMTALLGAIDTRLFLSTRAPFEPASNDALAGDVRAAIVAAGFDPQVVTPHVLRSAAATAAYDAGLRLELVMQIGGWASSEVFLAHYNRAAQLRS